MQKQNLVQHREKQNRTNNNEDGEQYSDIIDGAGKKV